MKKHNGRKLIYWYLAKTSFKGNRSISLFFTKKGTITCSHNMNLRKIL